MGNPDQQNPRNPGKQQQPQRRREDEQTGR